MGLQRFPYKGYQGGINLRDGPINLESDEAQDALNKSITLRGALKDRAGKTRFDQSGFVVGGTADFLRSWYFGSSKVLMASVGGDIYSFTPGGAGTLRFDGTAGTIWAFEDGLDGSGNDQLWAMNGVDAPQKWDGSAGTFVAWTNTPPNGTMMRLWKNRMVISGVPGFPQRIFFSDIANPESPAASYGSNWVDIKTTDDDQDPVTWMEVVGDYLLVFKRRSTWAVLEPTTFSSRRIAGVGCESRFQSCELGGRAYFLARDGVYSTDGVNVRLESELITPFFVGEENEVGVLNIGSIDKSRMAASRDRRVLLAVPEGASTSNTMLWEYTPELARRREDGETTAPWMRHSYPVSALCTFRPGNQDVLIAGTPGVGLHQLFNGISDDGEAINAYFFGSWKALFPEEPYERIRRINVLHKGDIKVELFRNFDNDAPAWSKVMTVPGDPDPDWDGGVWDGGTWDPVHETMLSRGRPEKRAQYHALKFSNVTSGSALYPDETLYPADDLYPADGGSSSDTTIFSAELAIRGGKEH